MRYLMDAKEVGSDYRALANLGYDKSNNGHIAKMDRIVLTAAYFRGFLN